MMEYGYIGVLIGTFFEGEATVLLGGVFSQLGYLELSTVVIYACMGTFLGDCTFFFTGKLFGRKVIERHEYLRLRTMLADRFIRRYGNVILFMMRFLAGFRSVILLLLGCTTMGVTRFLITDFLIAACWAVLVSLLGYTFGNVVYIFVTDVKGYEKLIVPVVIVLAVLAIILYRHFVRKNERGDTYGT
jgi:membrane protein DedA with SNARE-associated domain